MLEELTVTHAHAGGYTCMNTYRPLSNLLSLGYNLPHDKATEYYKDFLVTYVYFRCENPSAHISSLWFGSH